MDENNSNGQTNKLPPLPPSDQKSLAHNGYNNFYGYKTREFWGKNQISHEKIEDFKECNHFFERKGPMVECKKCHFGLLGALEISNGKLFYKGEPIGI